MTIAPELTNVESIHGGARTGTGNATVEAERDATGGNDRQGEGKEALEKKDSLPEEESLRMTSWVEVENESGRDSGEAEASGKEGARRVGDAAEERAPWEAEEKGTGEAEKEQTRSVEEELAMMEEKWREQCAINETLKQRLADEEERFRVRPAVGSTGAATRVKAALKRCFSVTHVQTPVCSSTCVHSGSGFWIRFFYKPHSQSW